MKTRSLVLCMVGLAVLAGLISMTEIGTKLRGLLSSTPSMDEHGESKPLAPQEVKTLKLSETARKNLRLVSKSVKPQTYWRTIQIPGVVTDRPGYSDRGVTSPAVGTVAEVHAFPGDTVKPGEKLFTLRLFSEYLQNTQAELFRATKELQLIAENRARLDSGVQSGAIPGAKIIELENQAKRQSAAIQGFRQDLLTRGLTPPQIDAVADGMFVSTVEVVAPPQRLLTQEQQSRRERPLNPILHGLVFSRVLFPRIQEFKHGNFKALVSY